MKSTVAVCVLAVCAGALEAQDGSAGKVLHGYVRALEGALNRVHERVGQNLDVWEDHSTWENAWVVETDYFSVRTTRSRGSR